MRQGMFPPFGFVLAELGLGELVLAPFLTRWVVHPAPVRCALSAPKVLLKSMKVLLESTAL